jgi:hypothetical protein
MNCVLRAAMGMLVVGTLGCASAPPSSLTVGEISEIFQIHAWRIPQPGTGFEWSLEVVTKLPPGEKRALGNGPALVTLRPTSKDEYGFVLKQLGAQGSGTMAPCREPEDALPICDGYSMEFEQAPRCIGDCSKAVLAKMEPMINGPGERWLLLVAEPSLKIVPTKNTVVLPIP